MRITIRNILCISVISAMCMTLSGCAKPTTTSDNAAKIIDTPPIQQRIFVLGDSLSAWYRLPYEDSYPAQLESLLIAQGYSIKVINWGESWDTSEWLKARIQWITAEAQTWDVALIVIGGNDGLQWLSTEQLKSNITEITQWLQARGIRTVIWGMQIPTNLWDTYRNDFMKLYPDVASATNAILIPFILSGVGWVPSLNLEDGIHPNAAGQKIVAQTVQQTLIANNLLIK